MLGEFFRGNVAGGGVLGEFFRGNTAGGGVQGEFFLRISSRVILLGELCRAVALVAGPSTGSVNPSMRS